MSPRITSSVFVLALAAGACTANISAPTGGSGSKPGEPGYVPPGMGARTDPGRCRYVQRRRPRRPRHRRRQTIPERRLIRWQPDRGPLRRLTHREYNNTVRRPARRHDESRRRIPRSTSTNGFLFHRAGLVSTLDAKHAARRPPKRSSSRSTSRSSCRATRAAAKTPA